MVSTVRFSLHLKIYWQKSLEHAATPAHACPVEFQDPAIVMQDAEDSEDEWEDMVNHDAIAWYSQKSS